MSPILGGIGGVSVRGFGHFPNLYFSSFDSIATVTVGAGGATVITFDNIPQTYTHLQIRALARRTGSATTTATDFLRFNQDSGNNYTWHYLYSVPGSVTAGASNPQDRAYVLYTTSGGQTANVFGVSIIDILDYTNTNKNKTIRSLGGNNNNDSNSQVKLYSSAWLSTSAVTRIDLDTTADDFAQYSQIALYGIKVA